MDVKKIIKGIIFVGLWSMLLIPFFVASNMFFPYITGKGFAFRIIVEIIFALWIYLAVIDEKYRPKFSWVAVSVTVFVGIMAIADFFAVNPAKAFLSNFERMDGWITLIHLLMYLLVFASMMKTEKIWLWFFRTSVATSAIMSVLAIREWLTTGTTRVSTTLGNPIYVAVYFLFNFFFALILLYKDVIVQTKSSAKLLFMNWITYAYLVSAFLSAYGIWRTDTRGVVLGVIGGLMITAIIIAFFEKENKLIRYTSAGVLIALCVLVGGFILIKNTSFVKNNSDLESFAVISWSGNLQAQDQARQYIWAIAIKGIEQKPLLGWGQEGFNYVFNKYYDPRLYSQEQWFDRAHDEPLDVAVAGGVFALLAYLAIFGCTIMVIWKRRKNLGIIDAALLLGLLAGYFFQNLFVFDNISSYLLFFTVLAYVYAMEESAPKGNATKQKAFNPDIANYVVAPILIILTILSIWWYSIRPIEANLDLIQAIQPQQAGLSANLQYFNEALALNTFGSPEIREQLVSITPQIVESSSVDNTTKQEFATLTYDQMQEQLQQTPMDSRYQLFMGTFLDNINQYQLALPYLQKAVALSPDKQTTMFELITCYWYLGDKTQALALAQQAYNLAPSFTDAQLYYAGSLIVDGQESQGIQVLGSATSSPDAGQIVVRAYLVNASVDLAANNKAAATAEVKKAMQLIPSFATQGDQIIAGIASGTVSQ